MVNEARLQKHVGEVGVKGVVLCSLLGYESLGPKGILWKVEIFLGSSEEDIDSGATTPESLSPKVLHAYPSCYSLKFCPIWLFVPGQGITDQASQQWRHSGIYPTWLHFKTQVVVWNQCSRVKDRGLAN